MSPRDSLSDWTSASGQLAAHVLAESESTLKAYAVQPTLVRVHVGIEANIFASGYGQRQVFELVQNAADAIFVGRTAGRVRIVLTEHGRLRGAGRDVDDRCANDGATRPNLRDRVATHRRSMLLQNLHFDREARGRIRDAR